MTDRNIEIMDRIVDEMVAGKTISEALKDVYVKRSVAIPYNEEWLNIAVDKLGMSKRAAYLLMRNRMLTLAEVVQYCEKQKITTAKSLGAGSGIETFETILNYLWSKMDNQRRTEFLIDVVIRNEENIREELM